LKKDKNSLQASKIKQILAYVRRGWNWAFLILKEISKNECPLYMKFSMN